MATTTQRTSARPLPQGNTGYEEFLQWLDEHTWAEWVHGEVHFMSPVVVATSSDDRGVWRLGMGVALGARSPTASPAP